MKYSKRFCLMVSIMGLGMGISMIATAQARKSRSFNSGLVQTECAWNQQGEQQNCSITFSGNTGEQTRAFWLYIPQNLDPNQGIVFYFHASGSDWDWAGNGMWESVSDNNAFAFIAAQNDSCETGWGNSCTDDEAYFLALVTAVETNLQIPPNKIFVHGFSAGAAFTYTLAQAFPDLIAAAGVAEGVLGLNYGVPTLGDLTAPVNVIVFHGDQDGNFPYCGETVTTSQGNITVFSSDMVAQWWTSEMNCQHYDSGSLCDGFGGSPTSMYEYRAANCEGGKEFQFYKLIGGIHNWYGTQPLNVPPGTNTAPYSPAAADGEIAVDEADATWQFFNNHPLGLGFVPLTSCRVVDTRSSSGLSGPLGPPSLNGGSIRNFAIQSSSCGIPSTALAYSLNVTAVPLGSLSYLSIWPAGQQQPVVSTLNSFDGQVVATAAIVPAGVGGSISVFASDNTDLVLDINGYFTVPTTTTLAFYPSMPCRVADTRSTQGFTGPFGPPSLTGGSTRSFPIVASSCGIPSAAQAYSLNVTAVPPGPLTYLSIWPQGQPQPVSSTLNSLDGRILANTAIVPSGTPSGGITVFVSDNTDLIVDINGYFAPPDDSNPGPQLLLYPVTPCRVADTRSGAGFSGQFGPPSLAAGETRNFAITSGSCGIPDRAQAFSLNMTVVPPVSLDYLTIWPAGNPQPVASTLNSLNGAVVANASLVPAGTNGAISVFVTNLTDLIIDVNAYFAP